MRQPLFFPVRGRGDLFARGRRCLFARGRPNPRGKPRRNLRAGEAD
jgi:hypothetical protein